MIDANEAQSIGAQVLLLLCCYFTMNFLRRRIPPTPFSMGGAFVCCICSCLQMWSIKNTVQDAVKAEG
jgi:high-affinity Fe2+/Pb2+ permease